MGQPRACDMTIAERHTTYLKDYHPPAWRVSAIALDFKLDPDATRVIAVMTVEQIREGEPLRLDGSNLKLVGVKLDGRQLPSSEYALDDTSLTISPPTARAKLEIETEIAPAKNTA